MRMWIAVFTTILPICTQWVLADQQKAAEKPLSTRPRGVPPQLTSFYQEREHFECLDGDKRIPFDQVNDDYCDCADGSDEPGTAACRNGKFYCSNFGYKAATIPSNRVNDFICDCCDGSDEWDSGTECPNICEAQGSKAREQAKQQRAVHEAGWNKRKELAKEGQKMLEERRTELERKKTELAELEQMKEGAEERKKEVEKAEEEAKQVQDQQWEEEKKRLEADEARELIRLADANGDGKLSPEELKKHAGFEALADGEGEESAKEEANKVEELLKDIFPEESPALDQQLLAEKLYTMRDFLTRVKEALAKKDKQRKKLEEPGPAEEEAEEKEAEAGEEGDIEEEEPAASGGAKPQYDDATRALIAKADEARREFDELDKKVGHLQEEIRDSEQFLEFEYGPDQAWAPMKGRCSELTNTQYTYKICMFDKTVQKDRGGYSEVALGQWGHWSGPDDGANKFARQKYEHGQSCWNGPERTTQVELECGEELELVDASEPNKCEYRFVVKAPAACRNPDELKAAAEHSEL